MAGSERQEYIEDEQYLPDDWAIGGDPIYIDADAEEDEVEQRIREWVYVMRRVGGTFAAVADREEIAPNIYVHKGIAIRWDSYGPARKLERDDQPQNREQRRRNRRNRPKQDERKPSPEASPPDTDDDEGLEPAGGTVVDPDPENAHIQPDVERPPAAVFAGDPED